MEEVCRGRAYTKPSPGSPRLSTRSSRWKRFDAFQCSAAPRLPIVGIASAHAHATRPIGPVAAAMTVAVFTISSQGSLCSRGATEAHCKYSLRRGQAAVKIAQQLRDRRSNRVPDTTLTRRRNALALFKAYAEEALAAGASPKGMEQAFAAILQISPSMWSQIKASRPIGDKLARQIETLCARPLGWLDETRQDAAPDAAEAAFVELALKAWRASSGAGRKELRQHLRRILRDRKAD